MLWTEVKTHTGPSLKRKHVKIRGPSLLCYNRKLGKHTEIHAHCKCTELVVLFTEGLQFTKENKSECKLSVSVFTQGCRNRWVPSLDLTKEVDFERE